MAYENALSKTAINSACDIFAVPVTQRTVEHGMFYVRKFFNILLLQH
jgi:hypothetical protein